MLRSNCTGMSTEAESIRCREIAASERAKADAEPLPNVKAMLLRSAAVWEGRADLAERTFEGRGRQLAK